VPSVRTLPATTPVRDRAWLSYHLVRDKQLGFDVSRDERRTRCRAAIALELPTADTFGRDVHCTAE